MVRLKFGRGLRRACWTVLAFATTVAAAPPPQFAGTAPIAADAGRSQRNAEQWDAWLLARIDAAKKERERLWPGDRSNPTAYLASLRATRERLARAIGCVDPRVAAPWFELTAPATAPGPLAESPAAAYWPVRWEALDGVWGEGITLLPRGNPKGIVVVIPDAGQTPEAWAGLASGERSAPELTQRLAASGLQVVILAPVDRASTYSGDERAKMMTNQPHREWIYRQAAPVGRHIIGYEVQKVRAAIDAFRRASAAELPAGVIGYGEGGLVALHAAAIDERIAVAWVAGYFQARDRIWAEPLYRNVWGRLAEFGDAEMAALVAPRALVIEACDGPAVDDVTLKIGPGVARNAASAATGSLAPAAPRDVRGEFDRARTLIGRELGARLDLVLPPEPRAAPGGAEAQAAFFRHLGIERSTPAVPRPVVHRTASAAEIASRQQRAVTELSEHAQALARLSDRAREAFFWSKAKPSTPEQWITQTAPLRQYFSREFIGRIDVPDTPLRPRTRLRPELGGDGFAAYEFVYDVLPGVEDWGLLLVPANLQPGERRPAVVCQHGANSEPEDLIETEAVDRRAGTIYRSYAARLASRGFVVFAPSMPNHTGGELFRQLQRKANPLRLSIFSLVIASQQRALQWLQAQPFIDPRRIGYYGMSYGGKAAMRVPVVLDGFAAVVCSGDFNDYVQKMTSNRGTTSSVLFNASPEMIEFDLAHTFSHAEMAALIAPRPFMVEHGYQDRVAPTEWVAAEYAKVRRLYFRLGVPERTAIFSFDGPHTVMGTETFGFLHRVLAWPAPPDSP